MVFKNLEHISGSSHELLEFHQKKTPEQSKEDNGFQKRQQVKATGFIKNSFGFKGGHTVESNSADNQIGYVLLNGERKTCLFC